MGEEKQEINIEAGVAEIAPKAVMLREKLTVAAAVALLDIDENEKLALEKIRQEAGQKRGTIKKKLQEITASSDIRIIRRLWNTKQDDMFMHFLGDQTRVGGFGSETN